MNGNINRADVTARLKDVNGELIRDQVQLTFYNKNVQSLSQRFDVHFDGANAATMPGVPAFPTGLAEVFIKPTKYRYKSVFINVVGGEDNSIKEDFFVDPSEASPTLIEFQDIPSKAYAADLVRILQDSHIGAAQWSALGLRNRATIFNLSAKMHRETIRTGQPLIELVNTIDPIRLDDQHRERIFALVKDTLLASLQNFPQHFEPVSGVLHHFPPGWVPVAEPNSFKTRDAAGNIQFTFARNQDGQVMADIDLDDHKGLQHAADVLKHKITGKDTDPYDIHEILVYFQHLDPGYRLA
jgi:hypothetical protein